MYIYTRDIANDTVLFEWRNTYVLSKTTTDGIPKNDVIYSYGNPQLL